MYELTKKFTISCMHKLENEYLTEEENKKIFGKCYRSKDCLGHGHNWDIILILRSKNIDDKSGMIMNFYEIKKIFKELIDDVYDHTSLNQSSGFEHTITTAENMSRIFYYILKKEIPYLYKVKVYETLGASASYFEE